MVIDEEEKEEDEESGHTDDEEDVDDINHSALPKETVHTNSPGKRVQRVDISKYPETCETYLQARRD
jgi:hypothetical protein